MFGLKKGKNVDLGPTIIRVCVRCGQQIKQPTLLSGNTFGARLWTDGKMDAPMFPEYPMLVKCPTCRGLFWIDEAKKLGEIAWFEADLQEFADSLDYETPTEADYLEYVSDMDLAPEKERYIRIRAWWRANDLLRDVEDQDRSAPRFLDLQYSNLDRLSSLLDESAPEDRLLKAEIARERAMFEQARSLLDFPFPEDSQEAVETIQWLCDQRNTSVAEITSED